MQKLFRTAETAFLAILTLASVALAGEQLPGQTRVTIRGSGNKVTIERAPAPAAAPSVDRTAARPDVLAEAVRLETDGFDNATVIDYLRVHRVDLPAVIDLESVRRLRTAGAGESVISYLSRLAALDIGATGEGGAPVAPSSPEGEVVYGAPYGYDMGGGGYYYGGGYLGAPYAGRFGHRGVLPARRFGFHPGHPFSRPVFPKVPMQRPVAHPMPGPHSGRPRM